MNPITISNELATAIVAYLANQKYAEVHQLIAGIMTAANPPPEAKSSPPPGVSVAPANPQPV